MKTDQQEAGCLGERGPSDRALALPLVHCYRQIFPSCYTLPLPTCLLWDHPVPLLSSFLASREPPVFRKDAARHPSLQLSLI